MGYVRDIAFSVFSMTYRAETKGFVVTVVPEFLAHDSDPAQNRFAWSYHVEIVNHCPEMAQLIARTWHITDEAGEQQMVEGPGVIGQQPVFHPGTLFAYTSGCLLSRPSGVMHGAYHMIGGNGEPFDIEIPAFSLDSPYSKAVRN